MRTSWSKNYILRRRCKYGFKFYF